MYYIKANIGECPTEYSLQPRDGFIKVSDELAQVFLNNPTYIWNGSTAVPDKITNAQCRLILLKNNMLDLVNSSLSGMSQDAQIEWEYSGFIHRIHPLVLEMGTLLGLSSEQLDTMFIEASKL
jgi:hypothetical protein